ncbi:MAG: division/cell wall cluster transcriptional repressor MraZ [Candidatus Puniceispirillales bacterium]|jgi:MraZ protein
MFLSTSHNKIDLKSRVSIPASYRLFLEKSSEPLILFKSLQFKCLEGTSFTRMQRYIDAIDEMDAMSDDAFVLRMMMADSFETKFDASGRIVIPETLMNFAELSDKAVFMGIGESFYIWNLTEYKKQYQKSLKILEEKGPPKLFLKKKIE